MINQQDRMNFGLISILIPAYNAANLISDALESICKQTYDHWEVIVVEDGTQDDTEHIINRFQESFGNSKIRYVRHTINQGASAARNTGFEHSNGEYIALLDHDDIWKPDHLEKLLMTMDKSSADLVFSPAEFFHFSTQKPMGFHGPSKKEWANFPSSLIDRNYIPVSGILMKRKVLDVVGKFDTKIRGVEDLDYWLRCLELGFKFEFFPEITNGYRQQSPEAITANKTRVLELHALLLRKHAKLTVVPKNFRDMVLARYHLGVSRRSFKVNWVKSLEFFYWSFILSPIGTINAFKWFLDEKLVTKSRYSKT